MMSGREKKEKKTSLSQLVFCSKLTIINKFVRKKFSFYR